MTQLSGQPGAHPCAQPGLKPPPMYQPPGRACLAAAAFARLAVFSESFTALVALSCSAPQAAGGWASRFPAMVSFDTVYSPDQSIHAHLAAPHFLLRFATLRACTRTFPAQPPHTRTMCSAFTQGTSPATVSTMQCGGVSSCCRTSGCRAQPRSAPSYARP